MVSIRIWDGAAISRNESVMGRRKKVCWFSLATLSLPASGAGLDGFGCAGSGHDFGEDRVCARSLVRARNSHTTIFHIKFINCPRANITIFCVGRIGEPRENVARPEASGQGWCRLGLPHARLVTLVLLDLDDPARTTCPTRSRCWRCGMALVCFQPVPSLHHEFSRVARRRNYRALLVLGTG